MSILVEVIAALIQGAAENAVSWFTGDRPEKQQDDVADEQAH